MISILVPLRLESEANRASHEHWRSRQKRAKSQRHAVMLAMLASRHERPKPPLVVRMTRIAPRKIADGDNYTSCFKHVRDAVAQWLGVDDRHEGCSWECGPQERGGPGFYGVRIEIVALTAEQVAWREEARRMMNSVFDSSASAPAALPEKARKRPAKEAARQRGSEPRESHAGPAECMTQTSPFEPYSERFIPYEDRR